MGGFQVTRPLPDIGLWLPLLFKRSISPGKRYNIAQSVLRLSYGLDDWAAVSGGGTIGSQGK